ncbi:MAG TPA: hypothetical protein VKV19_19910 [Ktedonobacteraceae bacterium]|nr:hypothetical protein [Ktedonobacteraceae bacterium]
MSTNDAVRRIIPAGSYVLFLLFLAGIWVAISPFVMTTQPAGQSWLASTVNNVVIGVILIVVALLGIVGYMLFALRDLLREAQARQEVAEQVSQAPADR